MHESFKSTIKGHLPSALFQCKPFGLKGEKAVQAELRYLYKSLNVVS